MNRIQRLTTVAAAMLLATYAFTNMLGVKDAEAATQQLLTIQPFTLKLSIQADNKLVVDNPASSGCDAFGTPQHKRGCIVAGTDEMVDINVVLTASPQWYFNRFQICEVASANKPVQTFPVPQNQCTLSVIDMATWVIRIGPDLVNPDASGFVDFNAAQLPKVHQFRMVDLNLRQANYFYGIEACDGNQCVWTDPGSQNNGRSWP